MTAHDLRALAALVVAVAAAAALANESDRVLPKGMTLKGKAPLADARPAVHIPQAVETVLPNGMRLIVVAVPRQMVAFELTVRGAGGYYDPPDRLGRAALAAPLLTEGTATRSGSDVRREVDRLAAELRIDAAPSSVVARVSASVLSRDLDELVALVADLVQHATFPPAALAAAKQRLAGTAMQQRGSSSFLAGEVLMGRLYNAHPAARVDVPAAALGAISRDELVAFRDQTYRPDRMLLTVVGDITPAAVRAVVDRTFGAWTARGEQPAGVAEPTDAAPGAVLLVDRPHSAQTTLLIGAPTVPRAHRDFETLQVLNQVLGAGPNSRLFLNLREDKGYTYGATSRLSSEIFRGSLQATCAVRPEVTGASLAELQAELGRLRQALVGRDELDDAKRAVVAAFATSFESPEAIVSMHTTRWLYGLDADYWSTYANRVESVTADQVKSAAERYLAPSRLQTIVVGDAATIAGQLAPFNPVRVARP